jgi:hypothetical protein
MTKRKKTIVYSCTHWIRQQESCPRAVMYGRQMTNIQTLLDNMYCGYIDTSEQTT